MSNSIVPGSSADVNVKVTALTTNPNVPVTYKTVILKKNLVNGVNTLTQEMMSTINTKYVVKYDYVLGENITVPADCILEFDGGSLNDNKLIFNNTILCGNVKLNTDFAGLLSNKTFYISWLFNKSLSDEDYYFLNENVLSLLSDGIYIFDGLKYIISPISVKSNIIIDLNGSEIKGKNNVDNTPILDINNKENIVIKNGIIDGNKANVSGNNAHGIRIIGSNKITISNVYFKNINRACIVSTDSNYITLNKIIAENCGGQNNSIGCLFNSYGCTNVIASDCVFKNSSGVGVYIIRGSNFDIRNTDIYNISYDNGVTLEDVSNVNLENIKIDTIDNVGLEINASENINVKNINIDNCNHHGLLISVFSSSTYKACKNILLQNLKISNSGENYYDINVISVIDCSIINLQCETIFITKNNDIGDNKNITISNTESSSLQIINSELSTINCSFATVSGSNYIINKFPNDKQNTIDIYYNKIIPASETDAIELPNNARQIFTMSGIIDVISCFNQNYSQSTKKLISFKITNNTYNSAEISSIDGTVPRPVSFSLTTPNLIISNNNNVEVRCILRIIGEY